MKQSLKIFMLSLCIFFANLTYSQDDQAKQAALEIIASISDDIATLVINHKYEKNTEVAKITSIKLVTTLADAIVKIIEKIKERKQVRSFEIYSDKEYQLALYLLADLLNQKIQQQEKPL